MSWFSNIGRRKRKRPTAKRKANRTRAFRADAPKEETVGRSGVPPIVATARGVSQRPTIAKQKRKRRNITNDASIPAPTPPKKAKVKKAAVRKAKPSPGGSIRNTVTSGPATTGKKEARTVGEAKKRGMRTFVGSDGRKKAAVTREELAASGLSLREYLNKQNRERKASGMASGGKVEKRKLNVKARKPIGNTDGLKGFVKEHFSPEVRKKKRLRNTRYESNKNRIEGANKTLNDPDLTDGQKERLITKHMGIKTKLSGGGIVKNTPKRSKVPKGGTKNNYCKGGVVSRGQGKAKRGIRATKLR